jgi:hypothetical protein
MPWFLLHTLQFWLTSSADAVDLGTGRLQASSENTAIFSIRLHSYAAMPSPDIPPQTTIGQIFRVGNWLSMGQSWLYATVYIYKSNVIPVQAVEALRFVRGWGSHIFKHSAHKWQQIYQSYMPAAFYLQEDFWYSLLLEAESSPGP